MRAGASRERGLQTDGERGEAAVEADGEDARARAGSGQRGVDVGFRQGERLLDPDGFAGTKGDPGEFAVLVMAGGDEDLRGLRVV